MKGLIYKDLIEFKTTILAMSVVLIFYIFIGLMNDNTSLMFIIMAVMMNAFVPMTCVGYDEQCGWDSFGGAFPVSRVQTVASRYLTEVIIMIALTLITAVSQALFIFTGNNTEIPFSSFILIPASGMIIAAIMNPILYKFGVQKARFVIMAIFLLPSIFSMAFITLASDELKDNLSNTLESFIHSLKDIPLTAIFIAIFVICIVIYIISMLLSISVYKKKDF